MLQNEAKVVCDFCWSEIGTRVVYAASPEKRINVVTEMCSDCRCSFRYDYNDFGFFFGVASVLLLKNDPEKMLMKEYIEYSRELLGRFKQLPVNSLKEITTVQKQDLVRLRDLASKVDEHRQKASVTEIENMCPHTENPFKQFEQYVDSNIKEKYSARKGNLK
jgi:hypothetical protein